VLRRKGTAEHGAAAMLRAFIESALRAERG